MFVTYGETSWNVAGGIRDEKKPLLLLREKWNIVQRRAIAGLVEEKKEEEEEGQLPKICEC